MKREIALGIFFSAVLLILISFSSAANAIEIEKKVISDVIAVEFDVPAEFDLRITNNRGDSDFFEIYSLLDVRITPAGTFQIDGLSSKTVRVTMLPRAKNIGFMGITYYVRGQKSDTADSVQDTFSVAIRPLSDIIRITVPEVISNDETEMTFTIANPEKINLQNTEVRVSSDFFDYNSTFDLSKDKSYEIKVPLKPLKGLPAGVHTINFEFIVGGKKAIIPKQVKLVETIKITESEFKRTGLLSYTRSVIRKNDGNVDQYVNVQLTQSIFESLFSKYSPKPTSSETSGLSKTSVWRQELKQGEILNIKITVDYTIPVLILAALIIAYIIFKIVTRKKLILRKKILKVRTKSGEFALKIVISIKNTGREIKDVIITDRIPVYAKIHEKFGVIKPEKVENDRLTWKFDSLMPGEEHVLSYIIYSKIVYLGKINVPQAVAHYTDFNGKRDTALSKKLVIINETEIKEEF